MPTSHLPVLASLPIDLPGPVLALAAEGASKMVLLSLWKPILLLLPVAGWAWIIAKVYDKHAAQFFLPRRKWNLLHMLLGALAVALAVLLGLVIGSNEGAFWAGFAAMLVVLTIDIVTYAMVANKDDRVPEKYHIRFNMATIFGEKPKKEDTSGQAKVALAIRSADEKGKYTVVVMPPQAESPEYAIRTAAEQVWMNAIKARASQLDIGPTGKDNQYGVSYLVDGLRVGAEVMPAPNAGQVMNFWKAAAKLDVADHRRKQTGQVQVEQNETKRIGRITSIGVQGGMRLTILFDPEQAVTRKQSEMGLLDMQMAELKAIVAEGKGVVLVAAPPDMGRTTTLYAITKLHDAYTTNVQTLELEPQSPLEGVRTNVWDPQKAGQEGAAGGGGGGGAEFSTTLRSILRRDPDVVSVAEMPDAATAAEVAKADHDRTRIYVSMRAPDALTAVQMYVKAVGDLRQAAESLHGVVAQRLVRKLCTNCRVAYPPTGDMLKKLGIPEGKIQQLYRKGGQVLIKNRPEVCPVCNGGGYLGQEALFEVYSIGPEERSLITQGNLQGLRASLRKRPLPTIQQVGLRKAVDGITSIEEVMRVTTDAPAPGAAKPAAGTTPEPASA